MKVTVLSGYTWLRAPNRLQMLQPEEHLRESGLWPDTSLLFDDAYLNRIYDRLTA